MIEEAMERSSHRSGSPELEPPVLPKRKAVPLAHIYNPLSKALHAQAEEHTASKQPVRINITPGQWSKHL